MKVGGYVRSPDITLFPIPGTIIRAWHGHRYQTRASGNSEVSNEWSGALPERGEPFGILLGSFIVEHIPEQEPKYAFNKTQRKILKWLRNLESGSTDRVIAELYSQFVFSEASDEATLDYFSRAVERMRKFLSESDLAKAEKICAPKNRPAEKCPFKVGQVLNKAEAMTLPLGSIVLFFDSHPRLVGAHGLYEPIDRGNAHLWSIYYDTDKFILKFINQ